MANKKETKDLPPKHWWEDPELRTAVDESATNGTAALTAKYQTITKKKPKTFSPISTVTKRGKPIDLMLKEAAAQAFKPAYTFEPGDAVGIITSEEIDALARQLLGRASPKDAAEAEAYSNEVAAAVKKAYEEGESREEWEKKQAEEDKPASKGSMARIEGN